MYAISIVFALFIFYPELLRSDADAIRILAIVLNLLVLLIYLINFWVLSRYFRVCVVEGFASFPVLTFLIIELSLVKVLHMVAIVRKCFATCFEAFPQELILPLVYSYKRSFHFRYRCKQL
jgi:hypothetical protein